VLWLFVRATYEHLHKAKPWCLARFAVEAEIFPASPISKVWLDKWALTLGDLVFSYNRSIAMFLSMRNLVFGQTNFEMRG
jgi:hypothetical protein